MIRRLLLLISSFLILAISHAHAANDLYVINSLAQTLSRIDLDQGTVNNHILTLGIVPNDIKVRGDSAYILHSVSDNILLYDLVSRTAVGTIEFARGENPWEVAFGSNGYAYVTNFLSGRLYEVDIISRRILREFHIGNTLEGVFCSSGRIFATDVNYDPDNHTFGEGKVYYSELPDLGNWSELSVGTNPQKIIQGPDGNLHVICTGNYDDQGGKILIIDPVQPAIIREIDIGGAPGFGATTTDGLIFLGAGGWVDNGEVFCYDGNTYEILNGPSNPITTGTGAAGIAADRYGFAYSCNFGEGTVSKIDGSRHVVTTFYVGDGPQAAALYNPAQTGVVEPALPADPDAQISVYPNPFNNSFNIFIQGIAPNLIEDISLFDLKGATVDRLFPGDRGWQSSISCETGGLPTGIYMLRLRYRGRVLTKILTLLK